MRRLRITMLSKLYPPWVGGLESHVGQLSTALASTYPEVQVSVVTGQESRARATSEEFGGVSIKRAATIARIARTPVGVGVRSLVRSTKPDLLHFHSPNPWAEIVVPLGDPGIRVVVTYYHDVVRQKILLPFYRPFLSKLLRRADRIIAWSPDLVQASPILRRYKDKVTVIPGGIETSRFIPSERSRLQADRLRQTLAPEGAVLLFVGRLVYYKGLEFLIRAMRQVRATLLIVGEGRQYKALTSLAQQLDVHDCVRFLNRVEEAELPLYFQASDLLVLPSCATTETFGLVQVEAHASAIPTICTALPTGVTSVNVHGVTGLVVPPKDSDSLAQAINQLLADPALRRRMGIEAQRRAVELFDIGRCAKEMMKLYRELAPSGSTEMG